MSCAVVSPRFFSSLALIPSKSLAFISLDLHLTLSSTICFSPQGKEMTVDVEPTYTIAKIKELLEEKEGIPVRIAVVVLSIYMPSDSVTTSCKLR